MNSIKAKYILTAIDRGDYADLKAARIRVYGNKGRCWSNTACITDLDEVKGQCNPRLASNYCTVKNIGCVKCLETLSELAAR
jgi:hypothetical protein